MYVTLDVRDQLNVILTRKNWPELGTLKLDIFRLLNLNIKCGPF